MKIQAYLFSLVVLAVLLMSCSKSGPDKTIAGGILGAGWGAGAGAVIGNQVDATGAGTAIGAGFGAVSGIATGAGFDATENHQMGMQKEVDALRVQVASNQRRMMLLQDSLDDRTRRLHITASNNMQLFFDHDRASLRSGTSERLGRFANTIKENPYVGKVALHGHSDNSGNRERNFKLSEARVRTVANVLSQHGIPIDRIELYSHGATRPLATNETAEGRQLNRRVEIVMLR